MQNQILNQKIEITVIRAFLIQSLYKMSLMMMIKNNNFFLDKIQNINSINLY